MGNKAEKRDEQKQYLDNLRKYKEKGVKITIDGEVVPEKDWSMIFRVEEKPMCRGSKSFYMADYIEEPCGNLSEIRLEKISVKNFLKN